MNESTKQYYILALNNFAYDKEYSTDYVWRTISAIHYDDVVKTIKRKHYKIVADDYGNIIDIVKDS